MMLLKNLSNFWKNYVIVSTFVGNQVAIFARTDSKRYVLVETLSPKDNIKLLHKIKSGF